MNSGITYFPLDVHLDDKFELIEAEFGLTGFAVVVKLLQKIYGGQGYYCEWTKDVALLFSKNMNLGGNAVSEIVSAAIKRGIFDSKLYDKYSILTSQGIQKRYFEAVSRRKEVIVKKQYLLVKVDKVYKNVNILSENVSNSSENVDNSEQRKEEESKGKESREEESNMPPAAVPQRIISLYENNISPLTPIVLHSMEDWLCNVDADMLEWAISEAAQNNKRTWKYIEAILNNHFNAGRTTLSTIQEAQRTFKAQKDQPQSVYDDSGFNYDELEEIMRGKL